MDLQGQGFHLRRLGISAALIAASAAFTASAETDVTVSFDGWNKGPEWVMPFGAGDLSAMASVVSNAVEIHLSKTDYLAEANPDNSMKGLQLLSPGHVTLAFEGLATTDFTSFRQTLDPKAGTVSVAIGTKSGSIECMMYGDRGSGALVCDVDDRRKDRGEMNAVYSIWRSGRGLIPEYRVFTDVKNGSVLISCGERSREAVLKTTREGRRAALAKWWADFWSKGYVILSGDEKAEYLTRLWWVNMYSYASVGYGPVPPKFNGGAGLVEGDRRHWGKDLWYQNTREMIWPMCVAGHPEFAKAILDFYDSCYENVLLNTPKRYPEMKGTEALVLPETMPFLDSKKYTPPAAPAPDVKRPYREPTDAERAASRAKRLARPAAHTSHVFSSGVELVQQMIEYVRFTGDRSYLPVIARWLRGVTAAYLVLLEREADGKWHVHATNVNETWWVKDDSTVDLAAARFVLFQTVAHGKEFGYPDDLIAAAKERLENLAPHPTADKVIWGKRPLFDVEGVVPGDRIFLPCAFKSGDKRNNSENNEMYLVFPFAMCESGDMREIALRTFPESFGSDCHCYGWNPESVVAARLCLTNAADCVYNHAFETAKWPYGGGKSPSQPLYKGALVEEAPYFDGTCVTLTGIQELLLQSHPAEPSADFFRGGEVTVLPCKLPPNWKVRFRLRARGGRMIEYPETSRSAAKAKTELGAPFRDGAVLQRDHEIRIWGTSSPGEKVKVSFGEHTAETTADAKGCWRVALESLPASKTPRVLKANEAEAKDVLVGEVWLCSGQSNAAQPLWDGCPRNRDYGYGWIKDNSPTLKNWKKGKSILEFNDVEAWYIYNPDWSLALGPFHVDCTEP